MNLLVETTDGELLSMLGDHVLLAKILCRMFAGMYGRDVRVRNDQDGKIWYEESAG